VVEDSGLTVDSSGYISIYGSYFGTSAGQVLICTNSSGTCNQAPGIQAALSAQYGYWSNTQVNALITVGPSASAGTYYAQAIASTDASGNTFLAAPQQAQGNQSNYAAVAVAATPASLSAVSYGLTTLTPCTAGTIGINYDVVYQVNDAAGNPVAVAGLVPFEKASAAAGTAADGSTISTLGYDYMPGALGTTDASGRFHDNPFGFCYPQPATLTLTQWIAFQNSSGGYNNVRMNSNTFVLTGPNQGSVSNGVDVPKQ